MNRNQYEELCRRTNLLSGFMMFKDRDLSFEKLVESTMFYYIQSHPNYSVERIMHTIARVSDLPNTMVNRISRAYPNKNIDRLKKIDINKLFTESKEQAQEIRVWEKFIDQ